MATATTVWDMRAIVIFFCLAAAVGIFMTRSLDRYVSKPAPSAAVVKSEAAAPAPRQSSSGYRTVTLRSDNRGHFQVEARVEGRTVEFMVDTGASMIAMRESSAARLGIHPSARDYNVKTQTANGVGRAARVRLNSVEVNGIMVRDVEAFVVPDDSLTTNLLGMSFLSRVKWTHDRGRLVLEQ
jgi:aspartyl protease family protein